MKQCIAQLVIAGLLINTASPVWAQDATAPPVPQYRIERKPFSPKLAAVGAGTVLMGLLVAVPQGEEWDIYGRTTCVNTGLREITAGGCTDPVQVKFGLAVAGIGGLLVYLGLRKTTRKVLITPQASHTGVGVTVAWGAN